MKRANQFITMGVTGLIISSVILIVATQLGSKFDTFSILLPFFVYLIIGLSKRRLHVKK